MKSISLGGLVLLTLACRNAAEPCPLPPEFIGRANSDTLEPGMCITVTSNAVVMTPADAGLPLDPNPAPRPLIPASAGSPDRTFCCNDGSE